MPTLLPQTPNSDISRTRRSMDELKSGWKDPFPAPTAMFT